MDDGPVTRSLGSVLAVAHRGGAACRPENTLEAFDHAVALDVDALELDIQTTADGQLVVVHDETVDRTTDGTGPVADQTLAELQALDAGHRFTPDGGETYPYRGMGVQIPTLESVLERYPDTPLVLELKRGTVDAQKFVDCLEVHGRLESVIVGAFEDETLVTLRSIDPRLTTGLGMDEARRVATGSATEPAGSVLFPPVELVTEAVVQGAHALDLAVWPWTANDPAAMDELIDLGVDAIITDDPPALLERR